jgi:hypothetical protein
MRRRIDKTISGFKDKAVTQEVQELQEHWRGKGQINDEKNNLLTFEITPAHKHLVSINSSLLFYSSIQNFKRSYI